ncbi:hypothetical protein D3C77_695370 [compost metagenome]
MLMDAQHESLIATLEHCSFVKQALQRLGTFLFLTDESLESLGGFLLQRADQLENVFDLTV